MLAVATREGGVDRNRRQNAMFRLIARSPPARVAWIETNFRHFAPQPNFVATREGGVDRNSPPFASLYTYSVATREGGVDRNNYALYK